MKVLVLSLVCALVAPNWAVPGGTEKIDDLGSDEVQGAAREAVSLIDRRSNSLYKTLLVEVTDGTQQVVQGMKYTLTMVVGLSSDCKKGEEIADFNRCHISETSTWTATIISHPWLTPKYEVTHLEQVSSTRKKEEKEGGNSHRSHMVGAPVPVEDTHDESVLKAAETAVTRLNAMSNAMFKSVLVEVVSGTVQVVNGAKYTLKLLVGVSQCSNDGQPATLQECPVELGTVEMMRAVVLLHPAHQTQPPRYEVVSLDKVRALNASK